MVFLITLMEHEMNRITLLLKFVAMPVLFDGDGDGDGDGDDASNVR